MKRTNVLLPVLAILDEAIYGSLLIDLIPIGAIEVILVVRKGTVLATATDVVELCPGFNLKWFRDVFSSIL